MKLAWQALELVVVIASIVATCLDFGIQVANGVDLYLEAKFSDPLGPFNSTNQTLTSTTTSTTTLTTSTPMTTSSSTTLSTSTTPNSTTASTPTTTSTSSPTTISSSATMSTSTTPNSTTASTSTSTTTSSPMTTSSSAIMSTSITPNSTTASTTTSSPMTTSSSATMSTSTTPNSTTASTSTPTTNRTDILNNTETVFSKLLHWVYKTDLEESRLINSTFVRGLRESYGLISIGLYQTPSIFICTIAIHGALNNNLMFPDYMRSISFLLLPFPILPPLFIIRNILPTAYFDRWPSLNIFDKVFKLLGCGRDAKQLQEMNLMAGNVFFSSCIQICLQLTIVIGHPYRAVGIQQLLSILSSCFTVLYAATQIFSFALGRRKNTTSFLRENLIV